MLSLEEQVKLILKTISGKKLDRDTRVYETALQWLRQWPDTLDFKLREEFIKAICNCFAIERAQLYSAVEGINPVVIAKTRDDQEVNISKGFKPGGVLESYTKYVYHTESPLSYHVFSLLTAAGCAVGRECWIDMGFFKLFGNLSTLIVGPTGKVHKTGATKIPLKIVEDLNLCQVMAEKPTPEAMMERFGDNSRQLIYAPEFSVFFGKQQYNEGLVTLVTRLLDDPDKFERLTLARGEQSVENPTLHVLGASTMSLLASSTPGEVLSGGFINRLMLVVEDSTPRLVAFPRLGELSLYKKVTKAIDTMKLFNGSMILTPEIKAAHIDWYAKFKKRLYEGDETTAAMLERMQAHLLRLALVINLMEEESQVITAQSLHTAETLCAYLLSKAPTASKMLESQTKENESDLVYNQIQNKGGAVDHSTLVRRLSSKMNAAKLKRIVKELQESGRIFVRKRGLGTIYLLNPDMVEEENSD